jgi:hypothetical protein
VGRSLVSVAADLTKSIALGIDSSRELSALAELQQSLADLKAQTAAASTSTSTSNSLTATGAIDEAALSRLLDEKLAGLKGQSLSQSQSLTQSGLGESLKQSLREVLRESPHSIGSGSGSDPSQNDKLEALLSMVEPLQSLYMHSHTLLYSALFRFTFPTIAFVYYSKQVSF